MSSPSTAAVAFPNAEGQQLHGHLHRPLERVPRSWVVFAHCFTCTADIRAAVEVSRALTDAGFGVLRFDFTGLGRSEGDFAETTFSTNVADLVAAAEWMAAEHGPVELLVGHSLGGAAVLAAAPRIESVRAVATIGAPARPEHVEHLLADGREEIEVRGRGRVSIGGRPFEIGRQFLDDLQHQELPGSLRHLGKALLVMHSPRDGIVSIDNAAEIYAAAVHPKSFVSLDEADHLLSRREDARYAATVLGAWASRYVSPATSPGGGGEGVTAVTGEGFVTHIDADGHPMIADEPASVGGTERGPTPYGFLSAALASCTSMTLMMYARHKKLALREASVRVRHEKIHAKDCADCETKEGKIDVFERELRLDGDLTEEQRDRLVQIADRCPVHRTLHGEIKVTTELLGD